MAEAPSPGDHDCPVCHEEFTEPKLLPCTHRVCKKCLLSWLQAPGEGGCPLCRSPILHSGSGRHADVISLVDNLPTDLATMALVESKKALDGDRVCGLCDDTVAATSFCLDCGDMLCSACEKYHKKIRTTREHKLEQLHKLTAERLAVSRRSSCESHVDRPAELYCPDHHKLICLLCATSTHRACSKVEGITDVAEKARAALKEQTDRLKKKEGSIIAETVQLEQEVADVQKHFQFTKDDVNVTFDHLQKALEQRRLEIIYTLQDQEDKLVSDKRAEKPPLDQLRAAVAAQTQSLEQLLMSSPDSALVGMLKQLRQRLDDLERQPHQRTHTGGGLSTFAFDKAQLESLKREVNVLGMAAKKNCQTAKKRTMAKTVDDVLSGSEWGFRLAESQVFCPSCGRTTGRT